MRSCRFYTINEKRWNSEWMRQDKRYTTTHQQENVRTYVRRWHTWHHMTSHDVRERRSTCVKEFSLTQVQFLDWGYSCGRTRRTRRTHGHLRSHFLMCIPVICVICVVHCGSVGIDEMISAGSVSWVAPLIRLERHLLPVSTWAPFSELLSSLWTELQDQNSSPQTVRLLSPTSGEARTDLSTQHRLWLWFWFSLSSVTLHSWSKVHFPSSSSQQSAEQNLEVRSGSLLQSGWSTEWREVTKSSLSSAAVGSEPDEPPGVYSSSRSGSAPDYLKILNFLLL